ncbi:hypothetical protein J6590_010961 [Homalodisca vitripennis]|nr:hypothetical protein J6590_010961 [Homalodisca vitripennis]
MEHIPSPSTPPSLGITPCHKSLRGSGGSVSKYLNGNKPRLRGATLESDLRTK